MVAAIVIAPAMEIKGTCLGFFPIEIACGMDDAHRQSNPDQERGEQYHRAGRLRGPSMRVQMAEHVA